MKSIWFIASGVVLGTNETNWWRRVEIPRPHLRGSLTLLRDSSETQFENTTLKDESLYGASRSMDELLRGIDIDEDFMRTPPITAGVPETVDMWWVAGAALMTGIVMGMGLFACVIFAVKLATQSASEKQSSKTCSHNESTHITSSSPPSLPRAIFSATPQTAFPVNGHPTAENQKVRLPPISSLPCTMPRPCFNPYHQKICQSPEWGDLRCYNTRARQLPSFECASNSSSAYSSPDGVRHHLRQQSMEPSIRASARQLCPRHFKKHSTGCLPCHEASIKADDITPDNAPSHLEDAWKTNRGRPTIPAIDRQGRSLSRREKQSSPLIKMVDCEVTSQITKIRP